MSEQTERTERIFEKIRPGVEEKLREKINWERGTLLLKVTHEVREKTFSGGKSYAQVLKEENKVAIATQKERECQAEKIVLERDLKNIVFDAVQWAGGTEEDADVLYRFFKKRKTEELQGVYGQGSFLSEVDDDE